ncbi:MAG: protein-glutamate O-methyltransferase [Nitrospirae bacterium]|nr:protein-glutamate O-methyltransferase [Nitrospirota bacterium]
MQAETDERYVMAVLSDKEFRRLSEFVQTEVGIKMPPVKKTMLEARLQRRLRTLGLRSFVEYCEYVFNSSNAETELVHMIDAVTTNKTDFFREPNHFDYLAKHAIPTLINSTGAGIRRPLMIWSAGCSTGEEPYTLTMVLSEFAEKVPGFNFMIIATDISTKVLDKAKEAIYEADKIEPVPMAMRKKYLLKGKDKTKPLVRIVPELRSAVRFRRLNFMDDDFGFRETMDVIFCRNVVIYFDKPTQERLLRKFAKYLDPSGYLFMGHSETLGGLNVPFTQVAPTVYRVRK